MKHFFEKYNLQIKFLVVVFYLFWSAFILYLFTINNKGIDLVAGVVIGVLSLFKMFDLYELYKKIKAEKRTNEISL